MSGNTDILITLIYDSMFDGVFSKNFFSNVLLDNYSSYIGHKPYGLAYFDVDGLGTINADPLIGPEKADIAFKFLVEICKKYFPQDTVLSRLGGDEFAALVQNVDKKLCDSCIQRINEDLTSAPYDKTKGLTITGASADSSEFDSTYTMLSKAATLADSIKFEKKATRILRDIPDSYYYESCASLIRSYLNEFLKEVRIPGKMEHLPDKLKYSFYAKVIETFASLANSSTNETTHSTNGSVPRAFTSDNNPLSSKELQNLYDFLGNNGTVLSKDDFVNLCSRLSIDAVTGFYTKPFFENFLAESLEHKLQENPDYNCCLINLDVVGLKICNTILGHQKTDEILSSMSKSIRHEEVSRPQDFVIDYGGGNFIVILPNTSIEDSFYVLQRILDNTQNSDDSKMLRFVSSIARIGQDKSFRDAIEDSHRSNFDQKANVKYGQLIDNPNIDKALKIFLGRLLKDMRNKTSGELSEEQEIEFLKKTVYDLIYYGDKEYDIQIQQS